MKRDNDLRSFMAKSVEANSEIEFVASPRFKNAKGEPEKWILKTLTAEEDEAIRKSCTKKVPSRRNKNVLIPETDTNAYLGKMAAACVVHPNLNSKELQDSYGVMGDSALLKTMLRPGEYADILSKIQEINGYDVSMEESVEEAKN